MDKNRIVLLDTDFISKAYSSKSSSDHLIDQILRLPECRFFCHEQTVTELSRRFNDASSWLVCKTQLKEISCYSDLRIIEELETVLGSGCYLYYVQLLKNACDAYGKNFFSLQYKALETLLLSSFTKDEFISVLKSGDLSIGSQNDLGEIKAAVLLQTLSFLFGEQIYIFCADDKNARNGMLLFPGVSCLSVLSAFWYLKDTLSLDRTIIEPYFNSYVSTLAPSQTTFRIMEAKPISTKDPVGRMVKVPVADVLNDLYADKFVVLKNGFLRYKA